MAERAAEAAAEASEAVAAPEASAGLDLGALPPDTLESIAERVYGLLRRDLLLQRDRRGGAPRWRA